MKDENLTPAQQRLAEAHRHRQATAAYRALKADRECLVIELHDLDGLSQKAIAELVGMDQGGVSRLIRAAGAATRPKHLHLR